MLISRDTGQLFWNMVKATQHVQLRPPLDDPLHSLFRSKLQYSDNAFRQATIIYEEINEANFRATCGEVAESIEMHEACVSLLQAVAQQPHVEAVVVISGLRFVWEQILERNGLSAAHIKGHRWRPFGE
jgi:hypothetical protein